MEAHRLRPSTFEFALDATYAACQLQAVRFYDSAENPIVGAICPAAGGGPRCLWLTRRNGELAVRAVGRERPPAECSDSPGLNVAISKPEAFDVLH